MIETDSLRRIARELNAALEALKALESEFGTIRFDPRDPHSIDAAIEAMETKVDKELVAFRANPFITPFIDSLKASQRQAILDQANKAQLRQNQG